MALEELRGGEAIRSHHERFDGQGYPDRVDRAGDSARRASRRWPTTTTACRSASSRRVG